jgi:hypothetical protein
VVGVVEVGRERGRKEGREGERREEEEEEEEQLCTVHFSVKGKAC